MSVHAVTIQDPKQLGALIKAVRKAQQLRQDEVGRISHSFVGDLEAGKPTVQLGKVFEVLQELGVRVQLELPRHLDSSKLTQSMTDGK